MNYMSKLHLILKALAIVMVAFMITSCGKTEYDFHELIYTIEYEDEPIVHTFSFSGTDDAWAKVFLKEKDKWKWYELIVSVDGGDEHTMMVTTSTFEIKILSFKREKNIK